MDDDTNRHVNGNDRKAQECCGVPPLGALRPVTKGKEVTHDEQAEVDVIEDSVNNLNSSDIKALVLYRARENVL